jgi:hypothetical protein
MDLDQPPLVRHMETASVAAVPDAAKRTVGTDALAWAIRTAQSVTGQSLDEGGYHAPSLAEMDVVRHAAEACLLSVMRLLNHRYPGLPIQGGALPPEVGRSVRRAALEGMPLWCLLRAVWLAGARISEGPAAPALFRVAICCLPVGPGAESSGWCRIR